MRKKEGFTLIELLIVIGIIAVLMAIAIVAINPGKQFAKANNAKRWGDVTAIVDAASMRIVENKGTWPNGTCPALPVTGSLAPPACNAGDTCKLQSSCTGTDRCYDICDCIVDEYLGSLPIDPTATGVSWTDCTAYNTGYTFSRTGGGRMTISAPGAQAEDGSTPTISVTR